MELQATTLSELSSMPEQKVEVGGCTHFSLRHMEDPQQAKTCLPLKQFVDKEQGWRLIEQLLVLD